MTQHAGSGPALPVRRRRHALLLFLTGLWGLCTAFTLLCMVLPTMPNTLFFSVSVLAYTYNPFLLVSAVLGGVLLSLARKRRLRVPSIITGVLTLGVLVGVAVPTARLADVAAENDVDLSVGQLFQGPEGGLSKPSATATYNRVAGQDLKMDVWRPENQARASNAALIYVYGGGFSSGDRMSRPPYFQHLTSQGITVFAMDYRLSTPTDPSYDKAAGDVKCAVGWVHRHADRYGVDTDRVAISGGSAGGNLALLAAYSDDSDAISPSCDAKDTSVRAVVDFYGPPDLTQLYTGTPSIPVKASLRQYLGGTPDEQPDRYRSLSPVTYIDAK
ncbi:alpha/beta hydrolase [Streptomyces sp. CRN 30]|uniref:alpha/beta hydrolase n=1 Tax=Streptomyces sp. CRN 30 TaxID=3075613 RepID=UPI002A82003B|nr:alpha/beta hydrolase [Streptomyces sp. CRN 30]